MTALRNLPLFSALLFCLSAAANAPANAMAPSGETWFTIQSPHFRVHHTGPLETYARAVTQTFERVLPELETRLGWKAPSPIDVIVMDPTDSPNGLAMNFPNDYIELFASPFASDSALAYYHNWANEIATHELTHVIANDTTLGTYRTLRSIFGSWVKPNGIQPTWLSEGLAVYQETSLSPAGRGRSPLLEALLREAVRKNKLNDSEYTSIDRFNDGAPWWPAGNVPYLLGYTIQALPVKSVPNLPGKVSRENADTWIFAPDRVVTAVTGGRDWASIWAGATERLRERYAKPVGVEHPCVLTKSGRFTGGHALSSDGWIYFSEEDWDHGESLARVRADAPCNEAQVERLAAKHYGGPSQVAVSPSGKIVAYSALDPGYETEFSDIYLWSKEKGVERLTKDGRTRDPAFPDEQHILYVKALADTSQAIVRKPLPEGNEEILFTSRPLERISGLFAGQNHIYFSLHYNDGHEKIVELSHGRAEPVFPRTKGLEFERNPFLSADGSLWFAAAYGHEPLKIWRHAGTTASWVRDASGYADRPVVLPDGKALVMQRYGLNGLDLVRVPLASREEPTETAPSDLHEYLTGEKPRAPSATEVPLPASVPYSLETSGTSLWPHYWFPEAWAAQDGFVAGASTSGNDALNYQRWYAMGQYDSRARFPLYRAYYRNRTYSTNFHFEAVQTNSYLSGSETSNRQSSYSVEAIFPLWDFSLAFGTAYRQKRYFEDTANNVLLFQNIAIDRSGKTPSAIAPNWGVSFQNFTAMYPSSRYESTFADVRPELNLYQRGLHPSHSVSLGVAAGISTNRFLVSNYYLGGGASPLTDSPFIVRGYPTDSLFGQRVATANLAYTLPIAHPYRGLGTNPIFLNSIGLRLMADAGTARFMALYSGKYLLRYERDRFFRKYITGGGLDLIATGSIFYHVPVSVVAGVHHGAQKAYGGDTLFYFALGLGINRGTFRSSHGLN